jgi:D-alanyl-D-alanine carboxypeptidase
MADMTGRTDGPIRTPGRENDEWSKLLEKTEPSEQTSFTKPTTQTLTASTSPLVRAAAAYDEAARAHTIATASLAKAQVEEQETRAEEERAHAELLAAVAETTPKGEKS